MGKVAALAGQGKKRRPEQESIKLGDVSENGRRRATATTTHWTRSRFLGKLSNWRIYGFSPAIGMQFWIPGRDSSLFVR